MTIDERLEKLTERHEALTGSMELFQAELRDANERWEARFDKLGERIDTLAGAVGDLIQVARLHEARS